MSEMLEIDGKMIAAKKINIIKKAVYLNLKTELTKITQFKIITYTC
jgi:hypothetical protein